MSRETLPAPRTEFQWLLRRLAERAMSVTHHDAGEDEPGYISEVQEMERKFRPLVHGYVSQRLRRDSQTTIQEKGE